MFDIQSEYRPIVGDTVKFMYHKDFWITGKIIEVTSKNRVFVEYDNWVGGKTQLDLGPYHPMKFIG